MLYAVFRLEAGPEVFVFMFDVIISVGMYGTGVSVEMLGPGVSVIMLGPGLSVEMLGPGVSVIMLGPGVSVIMLGPGVSVVMLGPGVSMGIIAAGIPVELVMLNGTSALSHAVRNSEGNVHLFTILRGLTAYNSGCIIGFVERPKYTPELWAIQKEQFWVFVPLFPDAISHSVSSIFLYPLCLLLVS